MLGCWGVFGSRFVFVRLFEAPGVCFGNVQIVFGSYQGFLGPGSGNF